MIKIRIGGWAGQGTVRAGTILGKALSIEQNYHVAQQRSYSAAVRSGIAYSDVVASKEKLDELVVDIPDYLVVMYQKTLEEWIDLANKSEVVLVDSSRVDDISNVSGEVYEVPAGRIAEDIGTSKAANVVLLGSLARISDEMDIEALKKTVKSEFPEKYVDINVKAIEKGYSETKKN